MARLNPGVRPETRHDAIRKVTQSERPVLLEENRRLRKPLTEGVDVEYYAEDGTLAAGADRLRAPREQRLASGEPVRGDQRAEHPPVRCGGVRQ